MVIKKQDADDIVEILTWCVDRSFEHGSHLAEINRSAIIVVASICLAGIIVVAGLIL